MGLTLYSVLLGLALVLAAPWWLWRMATQGRYRAGLAGRLGRLPASLDAVRAARAAAPGLVWLHAVSVGEVLAAERLVGELRAALPGWLLVVSTTTATGQAMATRRLNVPVFYYPLDFAFSVRAYLRTLRPDLFVTMESELWPRMLAECERARIPVAVVNARLSDRSFRRAMRLRRLWQPTLGAVTLFLAQGEETAARLRALGVASGEVVVAGNLKFDPPPPAANRLVDSLRVQLADRPVLVAGSTVEGRPRNEEELVLQAMESVWVQRPEVLLVLAPRHPERFDVAASLLAGHGFTRATDVLRGVPLPASPRHTLLLDTVGDLAAVYALAGVAFVGGSLVSRGGHNPLEAARWGAPITLGPSYENFREIVDGMRAAGAIRMLPAEPERIAAAWLQLFDDGQTMGERGRLFAASQAGATARTVTTLVGMVQA